MRLYIIQITLIVLLAIASSASASVRNLGVFGQVYPIAEPDALVLLKKRAAGIDWEKKLKSPEILKKIKSYKPKGIPRLARALQDRTFLVDMSHTLEFDIPDGKGGILYPAGYTFNPLDYMNYSRTLVVIDAADPEQVDWLLASGHSKNATTRILVTDGMYTKDRKRIKRHLYYAMPTIIDKFRLRAVPSVIRQVNNKMEVHEIAISDSKK